MTTAAPEAATPPPETPSAVGRETASAAKTPISKGVLILIGALLLVRVVALGLLLMSGQEQDESAIGGDARRYAQIATAEGTPYQDFAVEYPPVAYGLVRAVAASDVRINTLIRLGVSQLVLDIGIALLLGW